MVIFLSFSWGCLLVGILESYSFGIHWLIGSVIVYLVGNVKIYLWVVGWFCLSPFYKCDFYGRIWLLVLKWLGIDSIYHGNIFSHSNKFHGLGGFSKHSRTVFTIIWISMLFVIWKDSNRRIFHNKMDQLEGLEDKVKLQTYWWLKSYYVLFDFDYPFWRLNPLCCLQAIVQLFFMVFIRQVVA